MTSSAVTGAPLGGSAGSPASGDPGPWTILVGFDGSARGEDALDFADRLAAATGARLILACVYSFQPITGRLGSGDSARDALATARHSAHRGCETRIVPAPSIAQGLATIADADGADLIVLGSRHRGSLGEALAGATARALIARGRRLVAIVPYGHRTESLRRIGVLTDASAAGRATLLAGRALERSTHAMLRVHGLPRSAADAGALPRPSLADDLAGGALDVLLAPAWPHGLVGRLRRRSRHPRVPRQPGCPVIIVPAPVA